MQIMTLILTTSLIGQQSCENYFKYAALEAPQRGPGGHFKILRHGRLVSPSERPLAAKENNSLRGGYSRREYFSVSEPFICKINCLQSKNSTDNW